MLAVKDKITWWYNWALQPTASELNYLQYAIEYVPMVWGAANIQNGPASVPLNSKYLLGFNEPNFIAQANLPAQQAGSLWPRVQQTAIGASPTATPGTVKIVSPAVNYCGGPPGCHDTDPYVYLDKFFASCQGCVVDHIAVHWYACTADALRNFLNGLRKYNKPVWVTEFACAQWDGSWQDNVQFQINYMKQAVAILESDPMVFRYAWFSGRTTEIPHVNMFSSSGQLTQLGNEYLNQPCGNGGAAALDGSSVAFKEQQPETASVSTALIIALSVSGFILVVIVIAFVVVQRKSTPPAEETV